MIPWAPPSQPELGSTSKPAPPHKRQSEPGIAHSIQKLIRTAAKSLRHTECTYNPPHLKCRYTQRRGGWGNGKQWCFHAQWRKCFYICPTALGFRFQRKNAQSMHIATVVACNGSQSSNNAKQRVASSAHGCSSAKRTIKQTIKPLAIE